MVIFLWEMSCKDWREVTHHQLSWPAGLELLGFDCAIIRNDHLKWILRSGQYWPLVLVVDQLGRVA